MLYLYEIQVHKDYWRHKYGSRLMREVERAGVAASALGMVLTWHTCNKQEGGGFLRRIQAHRLGVGAKR